jgi:hypothetical protein
MAAVAVSGSKFAHRPLHHHHVHGATGLIDKAKTTPQLECSSNHGARGDPEKSRTVMQQSSA